MAPHPVQAPATPTNNNNNNNLYEENEDPQTSSYQASISPFTSTAASVSKGNHIVGSETIEEFQARFAARKAEHDRDDLVSASPSNSYTHSHVLAPRLANNNGHSVPLPIGRPSNSGHIIKLHMLAQEHKFQQPEFEFGASGGRGVQEFTARLTLRLQVDAVVDGALQEQVIERVIENEGPFCNKKEAKETVAERGVEVIKDMLEQRRIAMAHASTVLPEFISNTEGVDPKEPQGPTENYIGLLQEFCQSRPFSLPAYQIYFVTLQMFACEVSVHLPSPKNKDITEILTFGSRTRAIGSKKAAKISAAKAAILHLRSHNLLDSTGEPARKKQCVKSSPTTTGGSVDGSAEEPIPDLSLLTQQSRPQHSASPPEFAVNRAHALRLQLGLSNMEYRMTAQPNTAFYSGAAFFRDEPRLSELRGPLGEVTAVFGKKNAKEEIAKGVVVILEDMLERE